MKKFVLSAIVMSSVCLSSCQMFDVSTPESRVKTAKRCGRIAVMMWTAEQEKLKPEQKQAIVQVWKAFDSVIDVANNKEGSMDVKATLVDTLSTKAKLNDMERQLALQFVEFAWEELKDNVEIPSEAKETVTILTAFRDGVESGLVELK